jgi:Bacterial cadherin-like domain
LWNTKAAVGVASGGSWTAVGAVADNSALLLAADGGTRLYFQPNANFNGTVSNAITFRAWDQSSGIAGSKVDTAPNGGTTAFSTATDTADIIINAVNDAPDTAAGSGSGNEDTSIAVSLSGSDIDGSVASFKITSLPVNGTLYADAGLTDTLLVAKP